MFALYTDNMQYVSTHTKLASALKAARHLKQYKVFRFQGHVSILVKDYPNA